MAPTPPVRRRIWAGQLGDGAPTDKSITAVTPRASWPVISAPSWWADGSHNGRPRSHRKDPATGDSAFLKIAVGVRWRLNRARLKSRKGAAWNWGVACQREVWPATTAMPRACRIFECFAYPLRTRLSKVETNSSQTARQNRKNHQLFQFGARCGTRTHTP